MNQGIEEYSERYAMDRKVNTQRDNMVPRNECKLLPDMTSLREQLFEVSPGNENKNKIRVDNMELDMNCDSKNKVAPDQDHGKNIHFQMNHHETKFLPLYEIKTIIEKSSFIKDLTTMKEYSVRFLRSIWNLVFIFEELHISDGKLPLQLMTSMGKMSLN